MQCSTVFSEIVMNAHWILIILTLSFQPLLIFAFDRSYSFGGAFCDPDDDDPSICNGNQCVNGTCACDVQNVCPKCSIPKSLAEEYVGEGYHICGADFEFGGGICSHDSDCGGYGRGLCMANEDYGGICKCEINYGCPNCMVSIGDYLSKGLKCSDFDYAFGGKECERRVECGYPTKGTCARSIYETDGVSKCRCQNGYMCDDCSLKTKDVLEAGCDLCKNPSCKSEMDDSLAPREIIFIVVIGGFIFGVCTIMMYGYYVYEVKEERKRKKRRNDLKKKGISYSTKSLNSANSIEGRSIGSRCTRPTKGTTIEDKRVEAMKDELYTMASGMSSFSNSKSIESSSRNTEGSGRSIHSAGFNKRRQMKIQTRGNNNKSMFSVFSTKPKSRSCIASERRSFNGGRSIGSRMSRRSRQSSMRHTCHFGGSNLNNNHESDIDLRGGIEGLMNMNINESKSVRIPNRRKNIHKGDGNSRDFEVQSVNRSKTCGNINYTYKNRSSNSEFGLVGNDSENSNTDDSEADFQIDNGIEQQQEQQQQQQPQPHHHHQSLQVPPFIPHHQFHGNDFHNIRPNNLMNGNVNYRRSNSGPTSFHDLPMMEEKPLPSDLVSLSSAAIVNVRSSASVVNSNSNGAEFMPSRFSMSVCSPRVGNPGRSTMQPSIRRGKQRNSRRKFTSTSSVSTHNPFGISHSLSHRRNTRRCASVSDQPPKRQQQQQQQQESPLSKTETTNSSSSSMSGSDSDFDVDEHPNNTHQSPNN
eukprot:TRINITY_DN50737_c0_g1_i1.p1 TRINITY_DN50737_c0_g1~~TRINITY_DN50737_c0_g1_i1.p1  ORF type:complete len:753 (-),score=170.89 TRINITY_DN50737_c0_g1_i1:24-2282(-)